MPQWNKRETVQYAAFWDRAIGGSGLRPFFVIVVVFRPPPRPSPARFVSSDAVAPAPSDVRRIGAMQDHIDRSTCVRFIVAWDADVATGRLSDCF